MLEGIGKRYGGTSCHGAYHTKQVIQLLYSALIYEKVKQHSFEMNTTL